MKILMLTPYLPYPDSSGGQIRTQNLLKHLRREHDITLFSLIKHPSEKKYIPFLEKKFCKKVYVFERSPKPFTLKNILKTGFSLDPFVVVRNFSKATKLAIARELLSGSYDLIHAETFYAMPHIPQTNLPVVLVDQTIEYQVYDHFVRHAAPFFLRPLLLIDVAKLKNRETYYWRQADQVIAVSETDRQEMLAVEPRLKIDIVPNGVNMDLFKPKVSWETTSPQLLFVGNFNWMQNTEAAQILIQQVFPLVKQQFPQTQVLVVGQHPPASLKKLASSSVTIQELAEDDVRGIQDAYYHADIFVTPLKGPGGTRLKNLAAMASCLPIVSSGVGMSGLGIKSGTHALIADKPSSMAESIIELVSNPKKAQALAKAAHQFVKQNYDYAQIAKKLSAIYQSVKKQYE